VSGQSGSSMGLPLRNILLLIAVCAVAATASACGGGDDDQRTAEDVPPDAIALVDETSIPRAEFDELMKRAEANYKAQKRPFPKVGTPEYQDLKTRAVAFLVQRYQMRAEADELGVKVTDQDVDKKMEELKKEAFGGDEKKFQEALEREGLTEAQAREEIRDRVLQERLYEKVTEDVEVSDEDIQAYYDKNKQQFSQPATRDVRHILVKNKGRADTIHSQLENGGEFAALARQFSQDQGTKKVGGKLPVTKGSTVPAFDKVAFELDEGEVSEPVKTTFGWHIIKADGPVKPEKVTPLEEVKGQIKDNLLREKRQKELDKWLKDVERKYENATVYAAGFEPPKTETGTTAATTTEE
jgi:parvulin-like peptidyl-prolyl isomerase